MPKKDQEDKEDKEDLTTTTTTTADGGGSDTKSTFIINFTRTHFTKPLRKQYSYSKNDK